MPIGKSLRFEIFARDGFICQYCGQRPPDVVLELDHIHPRSRGGDDDPINLLTSCFDCNRGKRAKVLAEIPRRPDADLALLKAQQEIGEAKRYLAVKRKRDKAHATLCEAMGDVWKRYLTDEFTPNHRVFTPWINRYGAEEVERSIIVAVCAYQSGRFGSIQQSAARKLIPYVGGILRNRDERRTNGEEL